MFSTPLLIYVGEIPPERYAAALGLQALWLVILGGVCVVLWRAGSRRIVVQGG
jgi:ABC-2 type transport system ATP-binding protein/ABC-2 type transport system permease protein